MNQLELQEESRGKWNGIYEVVRFLCAIQNMGNDSFFDELDIFSKNFYTLYIVARATFIMNLSIPSSARWGDTYRILY